MSDFDIHDPEKLRQLAAELRRVVNTTTTQSAVTQVMSALAANCDALASEQDDDKRQLIKSLLSRLLDVYARMGRLLTKAREQMTEDQFAQFLTDHAVDSRLAIHAMQWAEGRLGTH